MATLAVLNKKAILLKQLCIGVGGSAAETLQALVGKDVQVQVGKLEYVQPEGFLASIDGPHAVIRASLDKDFEGKTMAFVLPIKDAITLSGLMMMTPDDVLHQRRSTSILEGEDDEAFGEVGNMLCSAADSVLREKVKDPIGARLKDHGIIKPGLDEESLLAQENLIQVAMQVTIGDYPATEWYLLVDVDSAQKWNGGAFLRAEDQEEDGSTSSGQEPVQGSDQPRMVFDKTPFDDIPQAPIRGVLASYLHMQEIHAAVRPACRRVGLTLDRHGRNDIPNPGAHRGHVVLLDVPPGEDRRFEWSQRLKQYDPNIRVVLILHHASKTQVLKGFMARADAILGWPMTEPQLSAKLLEILEGVDGPGGDSSKDDQA